MKAQQAQMSPSYWMKPVRTLEEKQFLARLRQDIYCQSGKVAEEHTYQSSLDHYGQAYFIGSNDKIIGTFSVCLLGRSLDARELLGLQWGVPAAQFEQALYIYFLGIQREARNAGVLKFVFAEIFKMLVRNQLQDIYVLADSRLRRRYKWIGFSSTQHRVQSSFPKSGLLTLLHTKQIRFGVYGLHADPIRWNWYLRTSVAELLREGSLPYPQVSQAIYKMYSFFAPLSSAFEFLASMILRQGKEQFSAQRRF